MSKTFFERIGRFVSRSVKAGAKPRVGVARRRLRCEPLENRCLLSLVSLGADVLVEGRAAGVDSDVVAAAAGHWTATAKSPWLHTTSTGNGNGLATFVFDANTGATRTGTLAIDGATLAGVSFSATLTVTQAGSSYVSASPVTTLVNESRLNQPEGVAVDASGNVYVADRGNNAIQVWNAATNTVSTLVSGLNYPYGVAVDASGNVYFSDSTAIREWNAATKTFSALVSSGLSEPDGLAVDASGNVYFANGSAVKQWNAATHTVGTLFSDGVGGVLAGVAVDAAGNVYFANPRFNVVEEWNAATNTVALLVQDLKAPQGVAVDGSGNVYVADTGHNAIREWNAATRTVSLLSDGGWKMPQGVAVDASGNLYLGDTGNNAVRELPRAFVSNSTVQPAVTRVSGLNQPYGVAVDASGNVYFADTGNNVIGQWNATTQTPGALPIPGLLGPRGVAVDGSNVYIADTGNNAIKRWNTVTTSFGTLVSSGLSHPAGVAVDGSGNVYFADTGNNAIKQWNAATGTVRTLVSSGLVDPMGVTLDAAGNVYVADTHNNAVKELPRAYVFGYPVSAPPTTVLSLGLNCPAGLAADSSGNLYLADIGTYNPATGTYVPGTGEVKKLSAAFISSGRISEGAAATKDDTLAPVLPAGELLSGPFAPSSDQSWLTVDGVAGGQVAFSLTQNTNEARTAHITLLGQQIAVNQAAPSSSAVSEEIIDNSQPGFWSSNASTWNTGAGLDGSSLISSTPDGSKQSMAAWWFSMPVGVYEIDATWTAAPNLTARLGLDLYDGVGRWIGQMPVNEQSPPIDFIDRGVGWKRLGCIDITNTIFHISAWNSPTDGPIDINAIRLRAAPTIDDGDVAGGSSDYPTAQSGTFAAGGDWIPGSQGAYGGSHVSSSAPGSGDSTATWTMPVTPGSYTIDVTWLAAGNLTANATYNIFNGTSKVGSVSVNQTVPPNGVTDNGVTWNSLGSFTITGTKLVVTLANIAADGQVWADAIRLLPAYQPAEIVNSGHPGSWTNSHWTTINQGLYGNSLLSNSVDGSNQSQAAWWFPVQPGAYEVDVTWQPGVNQSKTAGFDVYNASTYLRTGVVNEQNAPAGLADQGVVWQSLGTFTMTGNALHVSIWNRAGDGPINVDGVRIVPVSA